MKALKNKEIYPFIILLIILLPFVLIPKHDSFLFVNSLHFPFGDRLFKHITWLGEGFLLCCCIILLLFERVQWFFVFLIAVCIHVVLIQVNKQYLFQEAMRPLSYFKHLCQESIIYHVPGIKVHHAVSFPSGHTTGATFALSFIALVIRNQKISWCLALIGIMVGFSRVYLSQHFVVDVYFGYVFGTFSSLIGLLLVQSFSSRYHWMNTYLIKTFTIRHLRIYFEVFRHSFYRSVRSSLK